MYRRRSLGAEVTPDGVHFRVWAPAHQRVVVVVNDRQYSLEAEPRGWFSGLIREAGDGDLYRFRLGDDTTTYPDPASRFQPQGPHGPSEVIDPMRYRWTDSRWAGLTREGRILYEMHIGTFTREGTYAAAIPHLQKLADLGINIIELMPINEFAGEFGWGYDGVDWWAPTRLYGRPDDLRRFVDEAHAKGMGVILDVVYNHFGPDGCYWKKFTPAYFSSRSANDWGEALNFDGPDCEGVRELCAENAAYWIDEFHFDGLRIDATQAINDQSERHIVAEIADRARAAAGNRSILVTAENEPNDRRLLVEYGLDAMWNDDWHHTAIVATTGRREAYYTDYLGRPQELISMAKHGFLYQGQRYEWQRKRRGTPSYDIDPERLICCLENHDQVANSAHGQRLLELTSPGRFRAMTALLLLQPQTPLLFQGQERGSRAPFTYFADHEPELAKLVAKGRRDFLMQFPSLRNVQTPTPHDRATFEACKLTEDDGDASILALHRDLLRLRREKPFARDVDGAVLADECLLIRAGERMLIVNLGGDLRLEAASEPLLAPPLGTSRWKMLWSSEWPAYGGSGMAEPDSDDGWRIRGHAAVLLSAS